jgi:hypothetical protein
MRKAFHLHISGNGWPHYSSYGIRLFGDELSFSLYVAEFEAFIRQHRPDYLALNMHYRTSS